MNNELCLNLFNFDWLKYKKISVSKNEIYNLYYNESEHPPDEKRFIDNVENYWIYLN